VCVHGPAWFLCPALSKVVWVKSSSSRSSSIDVLHHHHSASSIVPHTRFFLECVPGWRIGGSYCLVCSTRIQRTCLYCDNI
jgi:hypothetical protein